MLCIKIKAPHLEFWKYFLGLSSNYTSIYICKNSPSSTFKMCALFCTYTNYTSIKCMNGSPLLIGFSPFFTQFTKPSSLMCVAHHSKCYFSRPETLLLIALALGFMHLFNNYLWGIPRTRCLLSQNPLRFTHLAIVL